MSNTSKTIIFGAIIVAIVLGFGAGFVVSQAVNGIGFFRFSEPAPSANQTAAQNLEIINEAWELLQKEYVEPEKMASDNITASAIEGIIAALQDPHMAYLTESDLQIVMSQFEGSFEGIGAVLGIRNEKLTIASIMKGNPAEAAGLMTGDVIVAINGESTEGMSVDEAVSRIRGKAGTTVVLTILHPDATEPVTLTITRARVEVSSVDYELRDDIAVISIYQFTVRTEAELAAIMPNLQRDNVNGIVLDLRDNPGGILDIVVEVASHFIPEGLIVSVRSNQGVIETHEAVKQKVTTNLPMVVLVNENSASGSEVLSGALQDHHRALIAGTTTYGKGSVNVLQPLSDGSGIYITISRWLTPDGRLIEGKGIEPDIALDTTGEEELHWAAEYLRK